MSEEKKQTDPEKEKRKIKSVKKMKEIMIAYYIEAKSPDRKKKIAWITSGGPVEPLIAMDVIPIYPENYGAMIGASKMGVDLCTKAEEMGYSGDSCSYARCDIASATVNGGPIPGGLPAPDFLVCCNNICGTVMKWYEVQARYFKVPLFILDTPFIHTELSKEANDYVRRQMEEYIAFVEEQTGAKMDWDRFRDVGMKSVAAQLLWQQVLDTTAHKPAPMTAFDAFFHLALIVTLRGKQVVVDYYNELLAEMKQRIADGVSMVPNEKHRLLWDNLPVWFRTKWLSDKFSGHNACLVADTYTSAWSGVVHLIDENDMLGSMAVAHNSVHINISIDMMYKKIREMALKYGVNGMVMHSNRSCKPYSFGQYDIQKMLIDDLGIPTLIIETDMCDERTFGESQIETRIDAFMEMLNQK